MSKPSCGIHVTVWSTVWWSKIVGISAITDSGGFFWPLFPMVFWGIGLVMNAWDVYFSSDISEQEIDHEISRMHRL